MKNLIEKLRFQWWAPWRVGRFNSYHLSHSQFGEDMVLRYLTNDSQTGFYVDLGAHHPVFLSNTYHFYRKGWRGLCVDAETHATELFRTLRPRDISVNACLSAQPRQQVYFYSFDQPALNTLDADAADSIVRSNRARLLEKRLVTTVTLDELLAAHLPRSTQVDFLSLDIEGIDEALILGHDWKDIHPRIIVFESKDVAWRDIPALPCVQHLERAGYVLESKCGPSIIMVDSAIV